MPDLFGEEVVLVAKPKSRKRVRGYAADPGTGPEGETCGSCKYIHRVKNWSGRKYWAKCGHPLGYISHSTASDIKVRAPACRCWEQDDGG